MKLLLLGASGLVGSETLKLALSHERVSQIIAPTRKPLAPHDGLWNPTASRLEELTSVLTSNKPDAVICALGTTRKKAGSKEAFRYVDHDLPVAFGKAAHTAGVETYALVTAMGASEESMSFYYRTKGEVERAVKEIGFRSLTICRPGLIQGERNEARPAEETALALARLLAPVLPKKFHGNPAGIIASTLLEMVITAKTGCHWIFADEMN